MERVIGVLKGKSETEKVEVLLELDGTPAERLHFRPLSWGKGIGWYSQKTIVLDCREIGALLTILNRANAFVKLTKQAMLKRKRSALPSSLQKNAGG